MALSKKEIRIIEDEINNNKDMTYTIMTSNSDNYVDIIGYTCNVCKTELSFNNDNKVISRRNLKCPTCKSISKNVVLNVNID